MMQLNLQQRAARCRERAERGDATILIVTNAERDEAVRLVGEAPCIVATPAEAQQFLTYLQKPARRR
jgi:hypothetical protein